MDRSVERAIEYIWERYSEPLTLTQIAQSALLSRFYFARLFRDTTGITPGRFLAAVRIHQAKRLLLSTSISATDISCAVGYHSLGSFTNYFTSVVGVSPGRFRRLSRTGGYLLPSLPVSARAAGFGAVAGTITVPEGHGNTRVYLAALPTPLLAHPCAAAVVVDVPIGRPSCYYLAGIPEGTWFVQGVAVADGVGPDPWAHRTTLLGGHGSVTVTADSVTSVAIRLRQPRLADPPVLLALPDLVPPTTELTGCPAIAPRSGGERRGDGYRRAAPGMPVHS